MITISAETARLAIEALNSVIIDMSEKATRHGYKNSKVFVSEEIRALAELKAALSTPLNVNPCFASDTD